VAPALGLAGGLPGHFSLAWAGSKLIYPLVESLVAVEATGESLQELIPNATNPESSADGRTIVYVKKGLWKADVDGRHPVQLAQGAIYSPVVTTDDQVIFGSTRDNQYSFWTVPLAGGTPSLLVAGPASVPDLSPDGKRLMYGTIDEQHPKGVMVVCDLPRCATSKYVAPVPPTPVSFLKWTPDGLGLAYINQANIWVQPLDGSTPYQLTNFIDGRVGTFAWSRDGKRLALTRQLGISSNIILFKRSP
jgi:Tol biopolymer transport system component